MSLRKKTVEGVVWSAGLQWGEQFVGFIVFSVLARLLGPEDFGLVALASVFINFLQIFNNQGIAEAIVQKEEIQKEHLDTAFWFSIGIGLLLSIASICFSSLIAEIFNQKRIIPVISCLSISFIIKALNSVQGSLLRRKMEFKLLSIRSFVGVIAGAIVGLFLAFGGYGVWSLVFQRLINILFGVLLLWYVSDWRPGFSLSIEKFKELLPFGVSITGLNLFSFLRQNSDSLLIGYFLDSTSLGYYNVAYRIMQIIVTLFAGVVGKVSLPAFSKLQNDSDKLIKVFYEATSLASILLFPVFCGVFSLAPELVVGMFGSEWSPSIRILQILSILGILSCISWIQSSIITAVGKPDIRLWITALNSILGTISFAFFMQWGIEKAAIALVASNYFLAPISIFVLQRLVNIKPSEYLNQFIAPICGTSMMVLSIFLAKSIAKNYLNLSNPWILIGISTLIGGLTFLLILRIFFPNQSQKFFELIRLIFSGTSK